MITLSTSAREHIIRMLKKKSSVLGIRVGVKGAGCSGFAYTLEYAYDVEEYDTVVDCQQFILVIDAKSKSFLEGMEMQYTRRGVNEGFEFVNPNVKNSCGCGESVYFQENTMAYSKQVLDHYENPRNVGKMDENDPSVGTGMVGAPACGDVMRLQIQVKDNIITDAKFKTYGCGSAIASSSLLTEWVKGMHLDDANLVKNTQLAEELALPPVKIHCSVLAEDAIKTAIQNYRSKGQEK